jgi:hypothetical protein
MNKDLSAFQAGDLCIYSGVYALASLPASPWLTSAAPSALVERFHLL